MSADIPDQQSFTSHLRHIEDSTGSAPVRRYGAVVAVELPEGTVRHPRLTAQVRSMLGRICAVDLLHSGVRVGFGARGDSYDEACIDCSDVTEQLITWLGLGMDAVVEQSVFQRDLHILDTLENGIHLVTGDED